MEHYIRSRYLIIAAILFVLCLAWQPVVAQNYFSVIGTVFDGNGRAPVPSIRVSLEDENSQPIKTVFSSSSGRFQFGRIKAGNYRLTVATAGLPFEPTSVAVELQSMTRSESTSITEEPVLVDIVLKRKKQQSADSSPGVVFAQDVPAAAREEFNRGANKIKKDSTAGIEALTKAIELFPDYFDAQELLGTEYVKQGQFERGSEILLKAVKTNPKAFTSMYGLGVAYLNLNRFDESIRWLEGSVEGDPARPNTLMMLGLAYGKSGRLSDSEKSLVKAYQLGGASVADVHLYLAGIYNKQEKFGDARREMELYLKEAKGIKDNTQIITMIATLKEKEKKQQQRPK